MSLLLVPLGLFLLISPAHAISGCDDSSPVASLPASGATDVPLDVKPLFVFWVSDCQDNGWTATLSREDDGSTISLIDAHISADVIELPVVGPLSPNTAYVLTVASDGSSNTSTVTFTTGESLAEPHAGVPAISGALAGWSEQFDMILANAVIAPVEGTESLIQVAEDDEGHITFPITEVSTMEAPFAYSWATPLAERPAEWCLSVRQRDIAGDWTEGDDWCAEIARPHIFGGCSASPHAPSTFGLLVGIAALLSRRRGYRRT